MSIHEKIQKSKKRKRLPPGTPPGTLAPINTSAPTIIRAMAYNEGDFKEFIVNVPEDLLILKGQYPVLWVDCDGFGDIAGIQKVAEIFGLHPLGVEDAVNMDQRAKLDDFENSLLLVCYRPMLLNGQMLTEQISIFLGDGFIITLQDHHDKDSFEVIRERLRKGQGRLIRKAGADYLAYVIVDYIIDSAFPVLELFGDNLDDMEDKVLSNPNRAVVSDIHTIKRHLHYIRRSIWPLRDALSGMILGHRLIQEETRFYLRDCFDHTLQIIDMVETFRERASGLMDLFLTSQNNRMNEIMKVLTIISTIFMPLSFIASLYGMNFNTAHPYNMPELNMPFGYISVLGFMSVCATLMLIHFWRRGWFR